jgi:hypothetical protein
MNRFALALAAGAALLLAPPASAGISPVLTASPDRGDPGADVTLFGEGWVGCSERVSLYFNQSGRGIKLGTAIHGDGSFSFRTHIQGWAVPGPAEFVGRQVCPNGVYRRVANVTVNGEATDDETVRYVGETEKGGRVSFKVIDGTEVQNFRFANKCRPNARYGSRVPGAMRIGDVSFSRDGREFRIFGRFYAGGLVKGRARQFRGRCDSGRLKWEAERVN